MSAGLGARCHALNVDFNIVQGDVSHFCDKAIVAGLLSLLESDVATERGFNREALSFADVGCDEGFTLPISSRPNFSRNISMRAAV